MQEAKGELIIMIDVCINSNTDRQNQAHAILDKLSTCSVGLTK